MTNKVYAFIGPHASGKSTMITQLMDMGVHYIPTYTTREIGKFDTNPIIYRFISKEDFFKLDFIVKVTYKGDYYGILKNDVLAALKSKKISMIILDANGVKQLNKLIKQNLRTIYLMVDYVALVERMLRLGQKNDEIKYHLEYAENNNEFDNWKIANYVVKNIMPPKVALAQILSIMGLTQVVPKEEFKTLI